MGEHLLKLDQSAFVKGKLSKTTLNNLGALVLDRLSTSGEWLSEIIEVEPFNRLVVSWNSETNPNTTIEIWIKIRTETNWSKWFSYGKWTTDGYNTGSFSGQKDLYAKLDIDELMVLEGTGNGIQIKAELSKKAEDTETPKLKRIAVTFESESDNLDNHEWMKPIALEVPPRCQLTVPDIGKIICSPTSVAMVMAYYGVIEETEKVAKGTVDNGASIYGNWSYNVAYAGEKGFDAVVMYCKGFESIYAFLSKNVPVIATIRIKDKEALEGALQAYPSGHLIVVTGYEIRNDIAYVLVNDPATDDINQVSRAYRLDQFMNAWKRIVYVIET